MWCWNNKPKDGPEDLEPDYLAKSTSRWMVTSQPTQARSSIAHTVISELVAMQRTLADQDRKISALTSQIVDLKSLIEEKNMRMKAAETRIRQLEQDRCISPRSIGARSNSESKKAQSVDRECLSSSKKRCHRKKQLNSSSDDQVSRLDAFESEFNKKRMDRRSDPRSRSSREQQRRLASVHNSQDADVMSSGYFGSSRESFSDTACPQQARRPSLPATLDELLDASHHAGSFESLDEQDLSIGAQRNKRPNAVGPGSPASCQSMRRKHALGSSPSVLSSPTGSTSSEIITGRFRVLSVGDEASICSF